MSYTRLVNQTHPLSKDYVPDDLVPVDVEFYAPINDPKRLLRKEAAEHVKQLFDCAKDQGISLIGISGYRTYARQSELYEKRTCDDVAPPGTSEHQSGLALDVSTDELGDVLSEIFAETQAGKWLKSHAPLYGFIIRYPKGKEAITRYPWEPWHIRYVTKSLALYLTLTGMTLEEYHEI